MKYSKKGIIGITLAAIMIASIFAVVAPTVVARRGGGDVPPGYYPNSTIRIYGDVQPQGNAPERYSDWRQPFNPTVIPKDSITFNPAIVPWDPTMYPMFGQSDENIDMKTYLRAWYEPCGKYWGPRKNHTYPTINLEYTYMIIDRQDKKPYDAEVGHGTFVFPIAENESDLNQSGLALFENDATQYDLVQPENMVKLVNISGTVSNYSKTVDGTIAIQKKYYLPTGGKVQFLDHKIEYYGTIEGGQTGIFKVWYAGNKDDDSRAVVLLPINQPRYFSRHNSMSNSFSTSYPWYANFEGKVQTTHAGMIDVGRFLWNCSVFYVDGIRYDVPAVEVLDFDGNGTNGPEKFKYITLRTKLPKCTDEDVMDESRVSSQRIYCFDVNETLPFLPPFNVNHSIVDDIDVALWAPLKLLDQWPEGDPNGVLGSDYFPGAEAFLTMQYPPAQWQQKFCAVPIPGDNTVGVTDHQLWNGPYYPDNNIPPYWTLDQCGMRLDMTGYTANIFSAGKSEWIAYKVASRIIPGVEPMMVYYVSETEERRLSTNLLEKLNESGIGTSQHAEDWTKLDVQTLPDQYTEFALPAIPDLNVSNYASVSGGMTNTTYQELHGDYLITTSLIAPNNRGGNFPNDRVAFAYDLVDGEDGKDLYVNADVNKSNPGDLSQNVTVRIYGDVGVTTAPWTYTHWEQPFNPTVIRKDSITFDAAKLEWSPEFPMYAQDENAALKQYLRAWYEPCYNFSKPSYVRPAVVTETTYMLLDRQDEKPTGGNANHTMFAFPIAANESTPQVGLELFENSVKDTSLIANENLVKLTNVSSTDGNIGPYNKTTNGTIRIEKKYYLENLHNETIQFLDHKLQFYSTMENGTIGIVRVAYAGNKIDEWSEININQSETIWLGREPSVLYSSPSHDGLTTHTWYVHFEFKVQGTHQGAIDVGKELQTGDIFYVDGVRYEVPAIEVFDHSGDGIVDKFKYITLRTPFPKELDGNAFCSNEAKQADDNATASSQWIATIPPCHPIPVLPPLNWTQTHTIVDDTDVVLWNPLKHLDKWPEGDKKGVLGSEYFPCAERYLTMQYPPSQWQQYFCVAPIDTDKDMNPRMPTDHQLWAGPYYPGNVTAAMPNGWQLCKCGKVLPTPATFVIFDKEHWIANDVNERMIPGVEPLTFCWKNESKEPRYSTNLLQVLNETVTGTSPVVENWTKFDIQTLPDLYTVFKLPVVPSLNISCYVGGDFTDFFYPHINEYPGSYLITTSFLAPNAKGDLNVNQSYSEIDRYAFTFNASYGMGIYMNEDPPATEPQGPPTIELSAGKNYVSMPAIPDVASPGVVFPGCEVWAYDSSISQYMYPPSALGEDLECGRGYLVRSPEGTSVEINGTECAGRSWDTIVESLTGTWNLIGPGGSDVTIEDSDLLIVGWNGNSWDVLSAGATLENTCGYWIYTGL